MRRLPVYLLLDTSGSMRGEPIAAVNVGLRAMVTALRHDPYALETVHLCIITYDREAKEILPLTSIDEIALPEIQVPESGPTCLGAALELLVRRVDRDVARSTPEQRGDWRPLLFLMTDGSPSDLQLYRAMIPEVKRRHFAHIVACAAGPKAKLEPLEELTGTVVSLDTSDSSTFASFFKWVSASVAFGSSSAGVTIPVGLPPPPGEVQIVL